MLALSFPRYGHPAMAWLAMAPLLVALVREPRATWRRAGVLGLLAGAGYFGGTIYWTPDVLQTFGGLNLPISVFAGALLVAYLALYPALFAILVSRSLQWLGISSLLLAPMFWVATELARRYVLGGFPWVLLGSSQASVIPIAQTASLAGVYGLSALIVLASSAAVLAVFARGRIRFAAPVLTMAAVAALWGWGTLRVGAGTLTAQGDVVRVALIQGDIRQDVKWEQGSAARNLDVHLKLTMEAAARGAQLVVWPESSTPYPFERDFGARGVITEIVKSRGVHLLFGSDQIEDGQPPRFYNAAFLLTPAGQVAAVYRKMHLVPFGEFIPLKSLLFFVSPLVQSMSDFSPGEQAMVMPMGTHRLSTAICYEVVYPDLVAEFVRGGSQLLTTITNDAWYGSSSAPYQHFEQASLRAVEQGRYLIRAANTGISGIVDPYGRVVQQSKIFERTFVEGTVRFIDTPTVYGQTGDAFAWACVLLTMLVAVMAWRRKS